MELIFSITTKIIGHFPLLLFICFLITIIKSVRKNGYTTAAPSVPRAWPIIGHLHLLGDLPHFTLATMADKHGPIFTIKLGLQKALVVSNSKMAKECFTTNDRVFATRPKSVAVEIMGYNYAMFALTQYGEYWRGVRKIAVHEFLSPRRLEVFRDTRVFEVRSSIRDMYEFWIKSKGSSSNMVKMEMEQWFGSLIQNIVVKLIAGKRYSSGEKEAVHFQKTVRKFFELLGVFTVSDAIPFLRWFDLGGHEKKMKVVANDMDDILEGWLQEHKRKRHSRDQSVHDQEQDVMDIIISIVEDDASKLPGFCPDTTIKANSLALLVAASDTSTVSLTWALSLLLNSPHALQRAQAEIDNQVGKKRCVKESDIKNLVYLQAIIKESLRLYPAAPLSVPHESMEDCIVGGYHIPKGTRLMPNIWKIQRDPEIWTDPEEFKPERFLTEYKDIDLKGQDFELIPFGSGRRMCPGMGFGLQIMQLTLASLIHGFEIEKPTEEDVDMSQNFGLTVMKATPLEVIFRPRLSENLYD